MFNDTDVQDNNSYSSYWIWMFIYLFIFMFLVSLLTLKPVDALSELSWHNYNDNDYLEIVYEDRPIGYNQYSKLDKELKQYSTPYINIPFAKDMKLNGKEIPVSKVFIIDKRTNFPYYNFEDNKIYFTDYITDRILNYHPSPLYEKKSYESFIGKDINIFGHYLEVGGVISTGYQSVLFTEKNVKIENLYDAVYITRNTLDTLLSYERIAPDVTFYDNTGLELFHKFDTKIIYDSNLDGNDIILSKDLAERISENSTVSKLQLYLSDSIISRGDIYIDTEVIDVIDDDNVNNTIYISDSSKVFIYENYRGFYYYDFYMTSKDNYSIGQNLRVILDDKLTENNIIVSKDLEIQDRVRLLMYLHYNNLDYIEDYNIVGTIEDENVEETIYVSQLAYDNFIYTLLKGGVITNLRSNPDDFKQFIPILEANNMYFKTKYKKSFINLRSFDYESIPIFILVLYIFIKRLKSYISKKINITKNTKIKDINKLIGETCFNMIYYAFIISIIIPFNFIFQKIYFDYLKVNYGFLALFTILFILLSFIITSLYFKITINKKENIGFNKEGK